MHNSQETDWKLYWNIVNLSKILIPVVYLIFPQNKLGLHTFLCVMSNVKNFLVNVLIHLLEHLNFGFRFPSFLLSKFGSQLKLIQSVVWVEILGICVTSSILKLLLSRSQVPSPRNTIPGSRSSGSQSPRILRLRVSGPDFRLCPLYVEILF